MSEDCEDAFAAMLENDGYVLFDYVNSDLYGLTAAEIEKEFEVLKAYKEMWEGLSIRASIPIAVGSPYLLELITSIKKEYFPEGD